MFGQHIDQCSTITVGHLHTSPSKHGVFKVYPSQPRELKNGPHINQKLLIARKMETEEYCLSLQMETSILAMVNARLIAQS